ncbi:hypothetical protein LVD17_11620 [Fulvivirga ulvae]|uniref:hypothetical protein n=1 Tax=Fulvivirga ulvae TaxID=2904245 RepID=UPI001F1E6F3A|nr:hypothetical protein [Fulvivirga ulvae]UII34457.1 hypothetical protein LVD17_11620 [Fulvivirga ulvae]
MKNIKVILGLIIAAGFMWSCDPLEDEIDEIKSEQSIAKTLEITLTDDDYELLSEEGVAEYGSFDSEDEAKTYIPLILERLYPQLGNGSSILVTYDIYNPIRINDEADLSLTEAEYDSIGENHPDRLLGTDSTYLTSESDIVKAVEYLYTTPENKDVVTLTYDYRNGDVSEERESKLVYYTDKWMLTYEPTAEDYAYMGQAFTNFDSRSLARERIAFLFNELYPFGEDGDVRASVFTYTYVDDNDTPDDEEDDFRVFEDFLAVFIHNGEGWVPQQDVMPRTLKFAHNGTKWIADNTIQFVLTAADYLAIAEGYTESNPDGATSMTSYKNYDLSLWTADLIQESLINYLTELYPPVDGQKFLITYATWEPGAGTGELYVIGQGGEYVLFEE